jgi:phage tail-like protein
VAAAFAEVSGLESRTDVVEYRTGNMFGAAKLPGLTKYTNIVLKRGLTKDDSLWQWRRLVHEGHTERRDGAIVLRDTAGDEVMRWTFRQGWPCRWEGPTLNAASNEVAIETLEIAHEGLELVA